MLPPKQGSKSISQTDAPPPHPSKFIVRLLLHSSIPSSHPILISHGVVTTGQDLSPVTHRDFLRVQLVFLQELELVV